MKYRTIVADPPWPYKDNPLPDFGPGRLAAFLPYQTMTIKEICSLDVPQLAAPGAHIYLWTTNRFIWLVPQIAEAWNFRPTQVLTWAKAPMGLGPGSAFANTTEFIVFGRMRVGGLLIRARANAGLSRGDVHRRLFSSEPTGIVYRWDADDCLPSPEQWQALQELLPTLTRTGLAGEPKRHNTSWFQWRRGEHSQKPEAFIDLVEQVSPGPYVELFSRRHRLGWDVHGFESANTATLEPTA